jgi:hypothetical protein
MKATIEFPSWIDENEWEYMGHKTLEMGDYGLDCPTDSDWRVRNWNLRGESMNRFFCFRKIQNFVWPEWVKDGVVLFHDESEICYNKGWFLKGTGVFGNIQSFNSVFKEEHQISTSKLDPNKVYIKGRA